MTQQHDTQIRPPPFVVEEGTLEERLSQVCVRLEACIQRMEAAEKRAEASERRAEASEKRLQIGDHMMAILEHDNSMCLYALKAFAKKLEAEEVEDKLASYIEDRAKMFRDIRGALQRIGTLPPPGEADRGD